MNDINVGDKLYTLICLSYKHGWGYSTFEKSFELEVEVVKTTKTQFTCSNGKRYYKRNLSEIGANGRVYRKGDKSFYYVIQGLNQSQEAEDYNKKLGEARDLFKLLKIEVDACTKVDIDTFLLHGKKFAKALKLIQEDP